MWRSENKKINTKRICAQRREFGKYWTIFKNPKSPYYQNLKITSVTMLWFHTQTHTHTRTWLTYMLSVIGPIVHILRGMAGTLHVCCSPHPALVPMAGISDAAFFPAESRCSFRIAFQTVTTKIFQKVSLINPVLYLDIFFFFGFSQIIKCLKFLYDYMLFVKIYKSLFNP